LAGLKHVNLIKTGDRTYCFIGEWTDMDAIANARPNMIAILDTSVKCLKTSAALSV
jgi:hypothetical protein